MNLLSLSALQRLVELGGWMMLPLAGVGLWLSWLLVFRTLELASLSAFVRRRDAAASPNDPGVKGFPTPCEGFGGRSPSRHPFLSLSSRIEGLRLGWLASDPLLLSHTLITAAPLLGLLGTVSGMITTFAALSEGGLTPTGGRSGIAEGIGQALLTTQMGLGIALPALLWQRLLVRWGRRLQASLERSALVQAPASFPRPALGAGDKEAADAPR